MLDGAILALIRDSKRLFGRVGDGHRVRPSRRSPLTDMMITLPGRMWTMPYGPNLATPIPNRGALGDLINGQAYDMSPAPSTKHQQLVLMLSHLLMEPATQKGCMLCAAPTAVVLDGNNVVQPDLLPARWALRPAGVVQLGRAD